MTEPTTTSGGDAGGLAQAAHAYRRRGWHPIPLHHLLSDDACSCEKGLRCTSPGKHPRSTRWQSEPAPSGADIEALWERWPKANVGLATGAPSGFFVVDIDDLNAHPGRLSKTYTVRTPSGGLHLYYLMPDFDFGNRQGLFEHVDIRATGGQVVAPPSIAIGGHGAGHRGGYTVLDPSPVAPAPAWLLDLLRPKAPAAVTPQVSVTDLPAAERDRLAIYTKTVVLNELERLEECRRQGWDGPGWNDTSFAVACTLQQLALATWNDYSTWMARADFFAAAPTDARFGIHEHETIWASASGRVDGRPRPMPTAPGGDTSWIDQIPAAPQVPLVVEPPRPAPRGHHPIAIDPEEEEVDDDEVVLEAVRRWLGEAGSTTRNRDALYTGYRFWADKNDAPSLTVGEFREQLDALGVEEATLDPVEALFAKALADGHA